MHVRGLVGFVTVEVEAIRSGSQDCRHGQRLYRTETRILNGAKVSEDSIVAAGAIVPEGREFPPRSLVVGIPAKRVGDVSEEQARE